MPFRLGERRKRSRENESEDEQHANRIWTCGDRSRDRKPVEEPDGYDKEAQYHDRDSQRGTCSDPATIVIVDVCIIGLLFGLLYGMRKGAARVFGY